MTPQLLVFDTTDRLIEAFAARFTSAAEAAIAARGRFACAVPGGSAAAQLLPALVDASVDWTRVDVFWVDERAVPPDSEESNFGLAWRLWLEHLESRPQVHKMRGDAPNLDAAATGYAENLAAILGVPPRLDLVLLGVGSDGHVASLFPGHPALDESARYVIAVRDAPKPPAERLTLTLSALAAARAICVAGFGPEKARVLGEAMAPGSQESPLPISRVLRSGPPVAVMLDTRP